MKRVICIVAGLTLSFAVSGAAQAPPPKPGLKIGFTAALQNNYAGMKRSLTEAAERVPEADYGFKPGTSSELRNYGQLVGHQADNQFINCALLKGVPNPSQGNEKKVGKAVLMKSLADAFAFCDDAIAALTDQSLVQMVKQAEAERARGAIVVTLLDHGGESAGIMEVYARAKGISIP